MWWSWAWAGLMIIFLVSLMHCLDVHPSYLLTKLTHLQSKSFCNLLLPSKTGLAKHCVILIHSEPLGIFFGPAHPIFFGDRIGRIEDTHMKSDGILGLAHHYASDRSLRGETFVSTLFRPRKIICGHWGPNVSLGLKHNLKCWRSGILRVPIPNYFI